MRTDRIAPGAGERGFMLVGVVMFMLALTILGLSLFSLSSYEAQFFNTGVQREQSLQDAESGMELLKALLQLEPQRLENAQLAVGQRGITSAIAYQWRSPLEDDTTSQGPVNWDSTIVLAVTARRGAESRTLQAHFRPTPAELPYEKLLAVGGRIHCNTDNGTTDEGLELRGPVWQYVDTWSDTSWTSELSWPTGRPLLTRPMPRPRADAFVDTHLPGAIAPTGWSGATGPYELTFVNPGNDALFFRSPPSPEHAKDDEVGPYDHYTFFVDDDLTIRILGTVVWVVPEGACFEGDVRVVPVDEGLRSTLVIVAKANGRDPGYADRGLWLQGGLSASDDDVRVFLVSEGDIAVTRSHNRSESLDARRVSIVAGGDVELGGPYPGYRQRFVHVGSEMVPLAGRLLAEGALPALSTGSSMNFVMRRSTWAETTPR